MRIGSKVHAGQLEQQVLVGPNLVYLDRIYVKGKVSKVNTKVIGVRSCKVIKQLEDF